MLPFIKGMRQSKPPEHIKEEMLSSWQSMLGAGKIFHVDEKMKRRCELARKYVQLLKDVDGLELPEVKDGSVVNRFPLLIKDKSRVEAIENNLKKAGIESSRMYFKPVYEVYGMESKAGEFKNAEYIAKRLLVLPSLNGVRPRLVTVSGRTAGRRFLRVLPFSLHTSATSGAKCAGSGVMKVPISPLIRLR